MKTYGHLPVPGAARTLPSFTEVGGAAFWPELSGPLPLRVAAPREHPLSPHIEGETESAHSAAEGIIAEKVAALPWRELETTQKDFDAYAGQRLELGHYTLMLEREDVPRAAAKYGRAVLHVTFGSALDRYRDALQKPIQTEQSAYSAALSEYFKKHLSPSAAYA